MNGKFEEKLAQLAFGDLSPDEAAQIEAQVLRNPEAARALAEYREMRGGLRNLAGVPEHQLSNERLRDAILTKGLRPSAAAEQPSRGLGSAWIWMPVAACALGFALISMRHQPGEPQIVVKSGGFDLAYNNPRIEGPTGGAGGSEFVPRLTSTAPPKKSVVQAAPVRPVGDNEVDPRSTPREQRSKRFTTEEIIRPHWGPVKPEEDLSAQVVSLPTVKAPSPADNKPAASPPASSQIVLIDSTTDADTGAPTATEVGTASNVLVGG